MKKDQKTPLSVFIASDKPEQTFDRIVARSSYACIVKTRLRELDLILQLPKHEPDAMSSSPFLYSFMQPYFLDFHKILLGALLIKLSSKHEVCLASSIQKLLLAMWARKFWQPPGYHLMHR